MYTFTVLGICLLLGVIWLKLWLYPDLMIVLGIAIIVFGYWWKWYWYWYYRSGAYSIEFLEKIEKKKLLGQQLTVSEKDILFAANEGETVIDVCNKLGLAVIAIGILLKIIF